MIFFSEGWMTDREECGTFADGVNDETSTRPNNAGCVR